MQASAAAVDTAFASTIEKSMDKRDPIPGGKNPKERTFANSASIDSVDKARERVEALDREWHEFATAAGVSRAVRFSLLRGEGSLASLRKIEDALVREEAKSKLKNLSPREAWNAIADELEKFGNGEFERMTEALQEVVRAEKRRRHALLKVFRATPDNSD